MYKSKLQELCQNKKWALPKYCCMKDGPDHNPKFKASVVVNGINFDSTPISCKSSKEAHNEAAKFAFLHFTSGGSLPTIEDSGLTETEEACQSLQDPPKTSEIKQEDSHYQYKRKLQLYAKRKNIGVPVYHSKRKSSSHDLCFEATVALSGELFKSPGAYKTAEEAEDAVAQLALMTLVTVSFQKSNTSSYKSFLQELAQHEQLCLPEYKTIKCGEPRNMTFLSSVEIEGEVFHGDAAKSKKQAEENAAKVASIALTKCKSFHTGDRSTVSSDLEDEISKIEPCMDSMSISRGQKEFRDKEEIVHSKHTSPQSAGAEKVVASYEKSPSFVEPLCYLPKETKASAVMTPPRSSTMSNVNASTRKTAETKSYLLCNRVRVYKSIPDEVFPRGTVVLPISEDKWVAVSLEFPNENCG